MKIKSGHSRNVTMREVTNDLPAGAFNGKKIFDEHDLYNISTEGLALYDGNPSSFTERPIDPIEIKPSPP